MTSTTDADLIVRFYEVRLRDPYLSASRWLDREFRINSWSELQERYPKGSDEFDALRTILEHWELIGGLVLAGQVDGDLLFETTGEHLSVWEKLRSLVVDARRQLNDPHLFENLELLVMSHAAWARRTPPKQARNAVSDIGEIT